VAESGTDCIDLMGRYSKHSAGIQGIHSGIHHIVARKVKEGE
jgi:hypothetical protein